MSHQSTPPSPSSLSHSDFLLEQYKMLQSELMGIIEENWRLEFALLAGLGAYYAWLFGSGAPEEPALWWIPIGIILIGAFRCGVLFRRMGIIGEYMKDLELRLMPAGSGLPTYSSHFNKKNRLPISLVTATLLLTVLVISFFALTKVPVKTDEGSNPPPPSRPAESPRGANAADAPAATQPKN